MKYVCSILLGLIALATSQAPGDEDSFCLEISSAPAYAPSVKPLMDSWWYRQLLGQSGVWHTLERDGDLHNVSIVIVLLDVYGYCSQLCDSCTI